jgi:hypothetical protein
MKSVLRYLSVSLLSTVLFVNSVKSQNELQSGIKIPVFPGSALNAEIEDDDSKICCSFVATDNFDKVVSFYENSLKIKSLDIAGLEISLPFMKQQTDMLKQQMPQGMKIKFFVLKVIEFQGQKGAEIFEVVNNGSGRVQYSLSESQLTAADLHFASEWKSIAMNEPVPIDAKSLVSALPATGPAGFEKKETEVSDGPPSVSVYFSKLIKKGTGGEEGASDQFQGITVSITDNKTNIEFADEMIKVERTIEKAVKVLGKYDGKESIEKNDFGCVESYKAFIVNRRYLVEIRASSICDISIINQVIDKMNLDTLPK